MAPPPAIALSADHTWSRGTSRAPGGGHAERGMNPARKRCRCVSSRAASLARAARGLLQPLRRLLPFCHVAYAYALRTVEHIPNMMLMHGTGAGAVILLVTLLKPWMTVAGFAAVFGAHGFVLTCRMDRRFLRNSVYTYNPLLAGFSVGFLFLPTPGMLLLSVASGALTLVVTMFLANAAFTYLRLPVFSLPFVVVRALVYMAACRYSALVPASSVAQHPLLEWGGGMPIWLSGYFRAVGAVAFMPYVVPGVVLCVLLLRTSRILFLLSALGFYTGAVCRGLMLGSLPEAFADPASLNFVLIAGYVGGIFLVPSVGSYLVAMAAVLASTFVLDATAVFWSFYGVPVYSLPFNVVVLGTMYALGLMGCPLIARATGRTPEEILDNHLTGSQRFGDPTPTIFLPFSGLWTVWQGFDGRWTHKGNWQHAYDFVITDDAGRTYRGHGNRLEDYYAFRRPVRSPVRARVIRVLNDLPDSPIGQPDKANNWGNLIVLWDARGFYVELSHFATGSIQVAEGAWVEVGTVLGLCGNSGFSPQPHIHVQVQLLDQVGAATVPFRFANFLTGNEHHGRGLPDEGVAVEPLCCDRQIDAATNLALDDQLSFNVFRDGRRIDRLDVTVGMAEDGTLFLESRRGKLYFGRLDGTLYTYRTEGDDPWLRTLMLALPRMPLGYRPGLSWKDRVPVRVAATGMRRVLAGLVAAVAPDAALARVRQRFVRPGLVESVTESPLLREPLCADVAFDGGKGPATIKIGNTELKRRHEQ